MREIIEGVSIIEGIGSANVFVLGERSCFELVDTGIFKMTDRLLEELRQGGYDPANLRRILLTHCHCDHIGGVSELVKHSGALVAAHEEDIPYILREKLIEGPYRAMMAEEQRVMVQLDCAVQRVDGTLKDGDLLDNGLRVILVPGHTPGSIALYDTARRLLFFGDVIRNNRGRGLTVGIPEKFNYDTPQTVADAARLLQLPIEYALFSHGEPLISDTDRMLKELLAKVQSEGRLLQAQ